MAFSATVETEAKYAGYIAQQERQIDRCATQSFAAFLRHLSSQYPRAFPPKPSRSSSESGPRRSGKRPHSRHHAGRVAVLDVYLSLGAHA
jgi:hypothetical protein